MKRKSLLFFMLMALFAPWTAKAQETPRATTATLPWSENFENYTSTTLGSEWATPATYDGKPCVLRNNSWASPAGSNSLECRTNSSNSNVFVFPQFDKPLNTLTVQFKIGGHTSGRGQFGYVTNASSASSFVSLTDIAQPSTVGNGTSGYTQYNYDLSTMSAPTSSSYRLAVKYTFVGSGEDSWYFDDFSVTSTEPSGGGVTPTCTPSFSSSTDFIASFSLGDINNSSSGFSSGGYGNFTSMSTNLQPGTSISASLTSSSGSGTHAAAVWIDFNDDGTFDSSTERVGTQGSIGASATVNISLSIPSNAAFGRHLMRVVYQYNVTATNITPCPSASYGEGEDYMVNIIAGPASLPYIEDFENGQNGWEFGNDNQTNYWMVGSNTSYSSSNSLYITNNGSANAYSNNISYVYAYRKLNIPSDGDYVVSFKWKANGESTWDLLRAFMIPASVNPTLTGGQANNMSGSGNTTPANWIDVANPSGKLNLQTTWQSSDKTVNLSTAGEYYLVFFWKNDGGVANTPPAAVDDIDIHEAATYNVTVSANGSGTVSGGGNNVAEGASVTVTATPNASNFINWTEDGTEVSTNPSYTFIVESDRNLVANFEAWTVSIASEPASTECLSPNTQVVLTASNNLLLQSLVDYTFSTGVDASKWYNVTSTTNIMDGTTSGDYAVSTVHTFADGFSFPFAGTNYTQFSVNADGNLRLGGTVTGTSDYSSPFSSSYANSNNPKINGMGFDGFFDVSTYGNYVHAQIFGEAPNRVYVVEFKESPYSSSYRQYTWNWQVQLSEDGTIQIVYGDTAPGNYNYSNQIGLCVNASDGWTVSTTTHEATHFTNGTSTTNTSATSWPGNNRYYRFSPVTYEWTYTGTAGTANGNVYTVAPTESSTYMVSFTYKGTTLTETINVTVAPAAPTNLEASDITTTTASVSWDANGASSWEYSIDGGTTWTSTSNTSVDLTGLTQGQTYTFQVKAVNGDCESEAVSEPFTTINNVTIRKDITGHGGNEGHWYLITSPLNTAIVPTAVTNMVAATAGDYDLFYFDQTASDGLEWRNYKQTSFSLVPGTGYLYANKYDVTLTFSGVPYQGDGTVPLTYSEDNESEYMWGLNLVGNPYHDAQAEADCNAYYTMNDGSELIVGTTYIVDPMEAIIVRAAESQVSMHFWRISRGNSTGKKRAGLALNVTQGRSLVDRAVVRFDGTVTLPKFQLNESHTKIYIPQDDKDYAVVYAESNIGELPVNFKAEKNGTYTIGVNAEEVSFGYLHLIDNKTGADVDLLAMPSYSFESLTTDYASRFKLVFATANSDDDNFGFYNGSAWVISNDGEAVLQVVDVTGRILKSESISGCASVNFNAAAGVYMLRLINGDNVKVQKVVVR